jgi:hypothetical protein
MVISTLTGLYFSVEQSLSRYSIRLQKKELLAPDIAEELKIATAKKGVWKKRAQQSFS